MTNKIKLNFNGKEIEFFFGLSFLGAFLKEENTDLQGIYIFGDIDGMLGTLDASYNYINQSSGNPNGTWVAFGEDITGEMYAVSLGGNIYKISGGQVASTEDFNNNTFKIYPNPSNEVITIQSETELINHLSIFDINL